MRKLFLFFMLLFSFVACSNETPEEVVQGFVDSMCQGDIKKAKTYIYIEDEAKRAEVFEKKLPKLIVEAGLESSKKGGCKLTELKRIKETKYSVTFKSILKYGNGDRDDIELTTGLVNGKWYVAMYF